MTTHKFKFVALITLGLIMPFLSCKDYLDVNINPNQSTVSRIDLQLSSAIVGTAVGIGQRIFPEIGTWAQFQTGGPGVALSEWDQHKLSSSEPRELFRELYRSSANLNYIVQNSTENNYIAIAKILRAYNFQIAADVFGDIPYTEALKGDIPDGSILHPRYDSAKDVVYPGIENELREAIDLLTRGVITPGSDDLIYGGDMEKWNKFAHSLLLKVYIRQGASRAAQIAELYADGEDQFILTNDEAAMLEFSGTAGNSNPFWNNAKSSSLGNYYVATTTLLDYLLSTNDPRLDQFFDPAPSGAHVGLDPGNIQSQPSTATFSRPAGSLAPNGGRMFSATAPVIFMSAWESNLLLAEAAARGYIAADAKTYYDAAVQASFEFLELDAAAADAYLAGGGAFNAADPIKSIALQKWVSMNGLQPLEAWIETRRFDSPATPIFASPGGIFKSPTVNALGVGVFPSILPYPDDEESLNQSFPGQHKLTDKVFWDN